METDGVEHRGIEAASDGAAPSKHEYRDSARFSSEGSPRPSHYSHNNRSGLNKSYITIYLLMSNFHST